MTNRLLLIICLFFLIGCSRNEFNNMTVATLNHPQVSTSGKYLLKIIEGYDGEVTFNQFEIIELDSQQNQKVVFRSKEHYRTRDTLFFLWDEEDRIWVYSGDLGTFYWTQEAENHWVKHVYIKSNVGAPSFLKKVRPKYHPK